MAPYSFQVMVEISAPKESHGFIIGREGKNLKRIMEETGARITVPPAGGSDVITIVGTKESVEKAKDQIQVIISEYEVSY